MLSVKTTKIRNELFAYFSKGHSTFAGARGALEIYRRFAGYDGQAHIDQLALLVQTDDISDL